MQTYSSTLSDAEFAASIDQNFTTILSSGEEIPLCPNGENKWVQPDNVSEFINLVLKAREDETKK